MATVLDLSLLKPFSILFPALLIWVMVYALLSHTKILGDNNWLNFFVSFVLGTMTLLSPDLVAIINNMVPWFVLLFIFVILLLFIYRITGVTDVNIVEFILKERSVSWVIFGFAIIVVGFSILTVIGGKVGPYVTEGANATADDSFSDSLGATLFNPKVLGLILFFILATVTAAIMGMKPT